MNTHFVIISFIFNYVCLVISTPKSDMNNPEINDQFETIATVDDKSYKTINSNIIDDQETPDQVVDTIDNKTELSNVQNNLLTDVYTKIKLSIYNLIYVPKINTVLKNIGTCFVNGAMEIVSFYLPAPLIPLIASAAGMIIPFEPIVMLRRRMPVTDYRRAIKTAVNGFLNTFNAYKFDDYDDPYMTRRFNRRFMNSVSKEDNSTSLK